MIDLLLLLLLLLSVVAGGDGVVRVQMQNAKLGTRPTELPLTNMRAYCVNACGCVCVCAVCCVLCVQNANCRMQHTHTQHTRFTYQMNWLRFHRQSKMKYVPIKWQSKNRWVGMGNVLSEWHREHPKINRAEMNLFAIYVKITSITFTSLIWLLVHVQMANTRTAAVAAVLSRLAAYACLW